MGLSPPNFTMFLGRLPLSSNLGLALGRGRTHFGSRQGIASSRWLVVAAVAGLICAGNDAYAATAVSANDFLNSIGACTHIKQGVDDPTKIAPCLTYAGVRNIRDDGTTDAGKLQSFVALHNASGAKICLLPTSVNGNIADCLTEYETLAAAGALLAAEGPNEPNNGPIVYDGQTSSNTGTFLPVAEFQRDLYSAVKSDPKLAGIPVFASSEAGGAEPDNVGLQFLTIPTGAGALLPDGTVYADYANPHNYVCAHFTTPVDNNAWNAEDPVLDSWWDGLYVEYGHTWRGHFAGYTNNQLQTLPRVTSETGWVTQGANAITEDQQGRLFLNLYLDAFKRGWTYTFVYMMRDDPVQGYWGLVHNDYTPKLSGTYVHNLTTILADNVSTTPGSLLYSIPNEPSTVHDLLLQKSNGTYELAVWDEKATGSDSVTVNLGATYDSVKLYDPVTGVSPTQTLTDAGSVSLTLSDHPVIIEISPLAPTGAVSRKQHGSAGDFDIPINVQSGTTPASGPLPIECRVGDTLELVVTFDRELTSATATVGAGATLDEAPVCDGNQMTIYLSDVPNAQQIQVNLTNIQGQDGSVLANATVSLGELIGDIDGSGDVEASDMRIVRNASGISGENSKFNPRADCALIGTVEAQSMRVVRNHSGTYLTQNP
jgi:hypothetical protein